MPSYELPSPTGPFKVGYKYVNRTNEKIKNEYAVYYPTKDVSSD